MISENAMFLTSRAKRPYIGAVVRHPSPESS